MKENIIVILILLSYIINAATDAIDHAKGAMDLYEVWHILKALSYAIPYTIILYLLGVNWQVWWLLWIALWMYWEISYTVLRYYSIWRLDDKVRIPFIERIWK